MNSNSAQLKLGIVFSYVSMAINMIVHIIYTPIMIRILGQSEYGLYSLVGGVVSYLSLFSLGFSGAYLRFSTRCEDDDALAKLNGMFVSLFLVMGLVALVTGMSLSQFTPQIFGKKLTSQELDRAKILMQILVVNISLSFPSSILNAIIGAKEQFLFQRLLNLAGIVFNPLICLPLLLAGYGSIALVAVTTIITIIKLIVNLWFCIKKLKVAFLFNGFNLNVIGEIFGFSFFLFLNMIIDQVNLSLDKFILGRVCGTVSVAVYGLASQINALFQTFSTAISSVFSPRINKISVGMSGDRRNYEFTELFISVGRIQFIVLMLIASGFVFFGKYFITEIYATAQYSEAYIVAMMLMLSAITPLIQNIGIEIQRSRNKHQFRSVVYSLMAILNLLISIPLAKLYGPIGAAGGTALSFVVANGIIMNVYYHKVLGINILKFWKSIFSLAKGLILPLALGLFINRFVNFENMMFYFIYITIYFLIYCFSIYGLGMNNYEKNIVKNLFNKFKIYKKGF